VIIAVAFLYFDLEKNIDKDEISISNIYLNKIDTNLTFKKLYDQKEVLLEELINEDSFLIINIWASWCLPCRDEHAYLLKLKNTNVINIIGINYKDKKSNAIEFLSNLGNPYFEVLVDLDGTKSIELGAIGVPETYLINNKIVVKKYIGPLDDIKFKEIIEIIKNEKN